MSPIRRYLRLNEIIGMEPWSTRISVLDLIKRDTRPLAPSLCLVRTWIEGGHLQATKRAFSRHQICLRPDLWFWCLRICEKINVCCISLPICVILLWWPGWTTYSLSTFTVSCQKLFLLVKTFTSICINLCNCPLIGLPLKSLLPIGNQHLL